jgi:hypothetical protein
LPEDSWRKEYPGIFHSDADLAEENKNFTLVFDALREDEERSRPDWLRGAE